MRAAQQERPKPVTDSVAAVARFVAGFTHQIKSPLTGVRGYGELLGREEDSERRLHWERRLQGGLESLDRMIEGARRYQVPAQLCPQGLGVAALIETCWHLALEITPGSAGKGVRLDNRVPAVLVIHADSFHFRNLLVNLLQNALDASPREGSIVVRAGERPLLLSIEDDGPGLAGLSPELIQQPFFTTRSDRAGLGLAVAAQIAAAHDMELRWQPLPRGGLSAGILSTLLHEQRSEP